MAPFCLKKSEGQIYIRNDNPCVTCSWHFWENVPYMGHIPVIFSLRSHFSLLYYLHDTSFSKVLLLTYMCLNSKMNLLSKHSIRSFFFFFLSSTSLLLSARHPPPSCTHAQSCNPMDCSLPGSSVHGLFQARILEWVAISFSKKAVFELRV